MNETIEKNEDKNQLLKSEENKQNLSNQINNLFISRKMKIPEKDNQHIKKKYIKFISIKKPYFKVENIQSKKSRLDPNIYNGRWTEEERTRFIQGIALYNTNWKKVKALIPTRTADQVRSHAQKFFYKMKLCKDKNLGIDFTLESVKSIKDMINLIKSKNPYYNVVFIFKNLSQANANRRFFKKFKKRYNNRCKIYNNISKNEDKNESIKLDKDNNDNDIKKNYALNHNLFENNIFSQVNNNNYNTNFELNNTMQSNNINNNDNTFLNILNNSLNINSSNNSLSNNYVNEYIINSNLLSDYLDKAFMEDSHIYSLSLLNDLLLTKIKLLHMINSIDNIYSIIKQDYNFLISNTLKNNNHIVFNTTNPIINNNYSIINNNNIPIKNTNNYLIINNDDQIDKNNKLENNNNKDIDKNNLIEINEKEK